MHCCVKNKYVVEEFDYILDMLMRGKSFPSINQPAAIVLTILVRDEFDKRKHSGIKLKHDSVTKQPPTLLST